MMKVRFGWVAFCALVATFGCRAPSPNWNGTWRLNPSKGNFGGTVITISISPDGEYRYDDGSVTDTFRWRVEHPSGLVYRNGHSGVSQHLAYGSALTQWVPHSSPILRRVRVFGSLQVPLSEAASHATLCCAVGFRARVEIFFFPHEPVRLS